MNKKFLMEFAIWFTTFLIALALMFPVFSQIDYKYDFFNWLQLVIIITYFRWIVDFDQVSLFVNTKVKMISIPILIVSAYILVDTGQHIILMLENQNLVDIVRNTTKIPQIHPVDLYNLYNYIHNLLIFSTWISGAISIILAIRIIASYVGYKSNKLKKYLEIIPK